jgi:hypothetical protein
MYPSCLIHYHRSPFTLVIVYCYHNPSEAIFCQMSSTIWHLTFWELKPCCMEDAGSTFLRNIDNNLQTTRVHVRKDSKIWIRVQLLTLGFRDWSLTCGFG